VGIDYDDNTDTVMMVLGTPVGLLALLDEETRFPGATDHTLVDKLHHNLRSHKRYHAPGDTRALQFSINHYAGSVTFVTLCIHWQILLPLSIQLKHRMVGDAILSYRLHSIIAPALLPFALNHCSNPLPFALNHRSTVCTQSLLQPSCRLHSLI
jgi:hypothetical protein